MDAYFECLGKIQVKAGETMVDFTPIDILAGQIYGLYRSDSDTITSALRKLAKDPKTGITETNEEHYSIQLGKKKIPLPPSSNLSAVTSKAPPLKGPGAEVVESGSKSPAERAADKAEATADDLLSNLIGEIPNTPRMVRTRDEGGEL